MSDLRRFVGDLDVESLVVDAVDRLAERQADVLGVDRRWYGVRAAPYKTTDHAIRGAVLSFVDIHADRLRSQLGQRINRHAVNVLSALHGALLVIDADQRVLWASHRYHELFHTTDEETVGNLFHNLGNGQWAHPRLRARLAQTLAEGTPFVGFSIAHDFERIGGRTVELSGSRILDEEDVPLVLMSIEEVDGEHRRSA